MLNVQTQEVTNEMIMYLFPVMYTHPVKNYAQSYFTGRPGFQEVGCLHLQGTESPEWKVSVEIHLVMSQEAISEGHWR